MTITKSILAGIVIVFFMACTSKPNQMSPSIEVISIQPDTICHLKDSISIFLKYEDKDGDLGENKSDVRNIFVTDLENNLLYSFRLQQLSPIKRSIHIRGELEIILNPTSLLNKEFDFVPLFYSIYLVDRAGNQSNEVTTPKIILIQDPNKCSQLN